MCMLTFVPIYFSYHSLILYYIFSSQIISLKSVCVEDATRICIWIHEIAFCHSGHRCRNVCAYLHLHAPLTTQKQDLRTIWQLAKVLIAPLPLDLCWLNININPTLHISTEFLPAPRFLRANSPTTIHIKMWILRKSWQGVRWNSSTN